MYIHNTRNHIMPFGGVVIFPGDNVLDAGQIAALKPYTPGFQSALKAGWLIVSDKPLEKSIADTSKEQANALFKSAERKAVPHAKPTEAAPVAKPAPNVNSDKPTLAEILAKRGQE